jgi:hypothetical protein
MAVPTDKADVVGVDASSASPNTPKILETSPANRND